jgi:hypothetical protein
MMHKYSEVFTGVGKLTDFQLELDIDDKVRPVALCRAETSGTRRLGHY